MAEDVGDRTEDPTEFRRQEARRKGQVARSADLNAAGVMLMAAVAMVVFGMKATESLAELLYHELENSSPRLDADQFISHLSHLAKSSARIVLPLMCLMALSAVGWNLMQFGFLLSFEPLRPSFSRISPLSGFRRLFSAQSVIRLLVSLGKLAVVVAIAVFFIARAAPQSLGVVELEWQTIAEEDQAEPFRERAIAPPLMRHLWSSAVSLAFQMAGALIVLGLVDYAFQRWKHVRDMRMTKQEVRDELKQFEGDPATKMRRREAHRKLAQARELSQVENADVVITNPTHVAVAVKFDPETMNAPVVVAKGQGEIARRIREIAAANHVPIIERKPLARFLHQQVKVGQEIPLDTYEVFVEIMAYVYQLSGQLPPALRKK